MDLVRLYLLKQVFTHGQFYVALSRVTWKKGLKILSLDEDVENPKFVKNIVYREVFAAINLYNNFVVFNN